ncbi:50S ribosomal protein L32 [Candidatus Saccharibacteria bacterium]|nr:50S ribosomal protein L32 [Candidatus Saccharibacteria bacterium]MCA9349904.1 50S ribosomal protein L32 [Candidatus Saccharibacteria bacterium]MCB9834731.1 50S ribosomal protein L32 [Candidatus Nomurabacteria bacterium]
MAVPKKQSSRSKVRRRRSHQAIKPEGLIVEPRTGQAVPRRLFRAINLGLVKLKK